MNRESYTNDYPVDPMGYPPHPLDSFTPNHRQNQNNGQMPINQPYSYQTPVSDFAYYQQLPPPPYQSLQYEPKYITGYQQKPSYWRGYQNVNQPLLPLSTQQTYRPNIVQKISMLIQSQIFYLRQIMNKAASSSIKHESKSKNNRSLSSSCQRSRSRQKRRHKEENGWLCTKCSFPNFQWRNHCKKCNHLREASKVQSQKIKEWKCPSCSNLNYARRRECNRCGKIKDQE